jgi:FKBP-type peptidyl-prolyl cis-trans isomerase FkpA
MNNYQKGNTSVIVSLVVVIVVIGLAVYGLSRNGGNSTTTKTRQTTIERTINTQNTMDNNVDSSALQAKAGDVLIVNYTGRLADGTVFDSNVDPKFGHVEPFKFILGAGYVIKGWDDGLVGMKVGEKRTLTIPPELGYGATDNGPIPANSTLIFEIELLSIE